MVINGRFENLLQPQNNTVLTAENAKVWSAMPIGSTLSILVRIFALICYDTDIANEDVTPIAWIVACVPEHSATTDVTVTPTTSA